MARFSNRQSLLTQIGILRLNLHNMSHSKGLCLDDARKEMSRLRRAPEAQVKELFADLKREWTRPRPELES